MLFKSEQNGIRFLKTSYYRNDYKILSGILEIIKIGNEYFPFDVSAIDKNKITAYKKIYNEYLERKRIGFKNYCSKPSKTFNLINHSINDIDSNLVGYGFCDTTGTSSGCITKINIEKALSELIEKNEALLLWYCKLGESTIIDKNIELLILRIGLDKKNLFIFRAQNLSNLHTFIVFLFDDSNRIISTGVCANLKKKDALVGALLECKLLKEIYSGTTYSPYNRFREHSSNKGYYYYVLNLSRKLKKKGAVLIDTQINKIKTESWIKSIYITVLNSKKTNQNITLRISSDELLSAIPTKLNIYTNSMRLIIKRYHVLKKLATIPECPII